MTYQRQAWVDHETVLNADMMTHIEDGIVANETAAADAKTTAEGIGARVQTLEAGPSTWAGTWAANVGGGSSTSPESRRLLTLKNGLGILHIDLIATGSGNRSLLTLPTDAPTPDALIEVQIQNGNTCYITAGSREVKGNPTDSVRTIFNLVGFWS